MHISTEQRGSLFRNGKSEEFVNTQLFNISNSFSHIPKNVYPFLYARGVTINQ